MNDDLKAISAASYSGMRAQAYRMKVVAENMANADSTGATPDADPYRRKTVTFDQVLDERSGATIVEVSGVYEDQSAFQLEYDPSHPMANAEGYVKKANVDPMIELANMQEASRSYEANLTMQQTGRELRRQLVGLLE
jgi:flagellar basal-body rod protein FlgC